eukprot:m.55134 g.55134  ORF g.55134 m.55134 type:complete len:140 (-) comp48836_c0_seq2:510-929(-)
MSVTRCVVALFLVLVLVAASETLQVKQTSVPADCSKQQQSQLGDDLTVHYTGFIEGGAKFDTSIGRGPFTFTVGRGDVIDGWEQGLLGMCVGEQRELHVPSELAYGKHGVGRRIPPNSNLRFEVELLAINDNPEQRADL